MKIEIKKILCILLCLVLAFTALVACSDSSKEEEEEDEYVATPQPQPEHLISQITFSSYLLDENSTTMSDYIADFNLKYPGVEVEIEHNDVSAETYFSELDERIETGTIGSVFLIDNERMAKYAAEGKIISLDNYIGSLLNYDSFEKVNPSNDLLPAAYQAGLYNGDYYMVASEYYHNFVFLNYDLLEESGYDFPSDDWSWDDLIMMAEKLKYNGVETPIAMDYTDYSIWGAFARSYGADIYDNIGAENTDKTLNLTDPDVVKGLEDLADLVDPKRGLVECVNADDIAPEDLSKYAFVIADHENITVWSEYLTDAEECDFTWDFIHFPRWNDEAAVDANGAPVYYQSIGATVYGFAVYNYGESDFYNDEYYKTCATLALYATVDSAAVKYAGDGETVPANKDANSMKFWRGFPVEGKNSSVFSHFAEYADFADNLSSFMPVTSESEIDVTDAINDYLAGTKSMAESLQELQDKANAGWIEK